MMLQRCLPVSVLICAALTVAACSSSTKASGGGSGVSGGATASGSSAATKSVITIGSAASLTNPADANPEWKSGMQAAIDSINAAGGVNGHPLKLSMCDTDYSASGELSCARSIVSNKAVVASVATQFDVDYSGAEIKLLDQNGIADFGTQGLSDTELSSPNVYPLGSGLPGWCYGAVDSLVRSGAKKITLLGDTNPASIYALDIYKAALKSAGLSPVAVVEGDPKADPTFATAAAKAVAGGVDGIALAPSPVDLPGEVKALRQAGYTGKISTFGVLISQPSLDAMGSSANGMLLSNQISYVTDTQNTGVAQYLKDMKAYAPSAKIDDMSLFSWSAVELFAKIIAGTDDYTRSGVSSTLAALSTAVDIGSVAPYAVVGRTSPLSTSPRILNPTITYGTVENGVIQAGSGEFVDPFSSLAAGK